MTKCVTSIIDNIEKDITYTVKYRMWHESVLTHDDYRCRRCLARGRRKSDIFDRNLPVLYVAKLFRISDSLNININDTLDTVIKRFNWGVNDGVTVCVQCFHEISKRPEKKDAVYKHLIKNRP